MYSCYVLCDCFCFPIYQFTSSSISPFISLHRHCFSHRWIKLHTFLFLFFYNIKHPFIPTGGKQRKADTQTHNHNLPFSQGSAKQFLLPLGILPQLPLDIVLSQLLSFTANSKHLTHHVQLRVVNYPTTKGFLQPDYKQTRDRLKYIINCYMPSLYQWALHILLNACFLLSDKFWDTINQRI
jgi:hypothetical protein